MPSSGSIAAWRARPEHVRCAAPELAWRHRRPRLPRSRTPADGFEVSGAISSCSGSSGSRRMPAFAGSSADRSASDSDSPCRRSCLRRSWQLAPIVRRRAYRRDQGACVPAAAARARPDVDPRNSAPSSRGSGGTPETRTSSSSGGSCITSPGVSSGRAVSCRETMRWPSQG